MVSIMTTRGAGWSGVRIPAPTQLPTQGVLDPFLGVKWPWLGVDHSPYLAPCYRMNGSVLLFPLHACMSRTGTILPSFHEQKKKKTHENVTSRYPR